MVELPYLDACLYTLNKHNWLVLMLMSRKVPERLLKSREEEQTVTVCSDAWWLMQMQVLQLPAGGRRLKSFRVCVELVCRGLNILVKEDINARKILAAVFSFG